MLLYHCKILSCCDDKNVNVEDTQNLLAAN
jgi:hypothetical protein